MAPQQPSYCLQNQTTHSAALFRMAQAGIMSAPFVVGATSPIGGVHATFGGVMAVTGNAAMTVTIATGLVYMPSSTAWSGMYAGYNTASYTISLAAASSTQWRTDVIAAVQNDSATSTSYAGVTTGVDGWDIVAVEGTFSSSSPGATPALPSNAVPLALVRVTPNMTVTNGGGTVVDARVYVPMDGPWPTTSSARPSLSAPEGTMWWENDTNLLGIIVSGAYNYVPYYSVVATDPWHNFGGILSGWTVSGVARYRLMPTNEVLIDLNNIVPPGSPPADGTTIWVIANGLPTGYRPIRTYTRNVYSAIQGTEVPAWRFNTDGSITVYGVSGTATTRMDFYGSIPLN
jgi:hypothetical protein